MSTDRTTSEEATTNLLVREAQLQSEVREGSLARIMETSLDLGTSDEGSSEIIRYGSLDLRSDSPAVMEITWTIENFFNLPCTPEEGILSQDFPFPGGEAFCTLHSAGTVEKPDFVRFWILIQCPAGKGMRDPEMECEVALKADDGTLCGSVVSEDSQKLGALLGYFERYFRRSEIFRRRESLVPGGVLTACIKLKSREEAAHESGSE